MKKIIQYLHDNMLSIQLGLYAHFNEWFLIPSIKVLKNGKFLEISLFILWFELYSCITIRNIDYES